MYFVLLFFPFCILVFPSFVIITHLILLNLIDYIVTMSMCLLLSLLVLHQPSCSSCCISCIGFFFCALCFLCLAALLHTFEVVQHATDTTCFPVCQALSQLYHWVIMWGTFLPFHILLWLCSAFYFAYHVKLFVVF